MQLIPSVLSLETLITASPQSRAALLADRPVDPYQ
jgi:hypothetical protein